MSASILTTIKQALTTFTSKKEVFNQNLTILKCLMNNITQNDVDLHLQFSKDELWNKPGKAPLTYIDIYEDDIITVGIFVLKPGMKIPLHDHPGMYGLIKVLMGTVKVSTFTVLNQLDYTNKESIYPDIITVEKHEEFLADKSNEACVLEPQSKNLHEIESVGGPAAFLDILSPPYETEDVNFGPRKCTYFEILKQLTPKLFNITECSQPSWLWSDSYPYTGPHIAKEELHN